MTDKTEPFTLDAGSHEVALIDKTLSWTPYQNIGFFEGT